MTTIAKINSRTVACTRDAGSYNFQRQPLKSYITTFETYNPREGHIVTHKF